MNNTCIYIIIFSALSFFLSHAIAQGNEHQKDSITLSGYLEAYYVYSSDRPQDHTLPSFIYNYNRTGEVNINLAFFKVNYGAQNLRANFAIAAGTCVNANYAANADYDLSSKAMWRIEIRNLSSKEELFINKENNFVNKNAIISTALSIAF